MLGGTAARACVRPASVGNSTAAWAVYEPSVMNSRANVFSPASTAVGRDERKGIA